MMAAKMNVTEFATVTGMLPLSKPYNNQNNVPLVNNAYMYSEMPEVSFVFMVLIACGRKETVVQNAAISPRMVMPVVVMQVN